MPPGLSWGLSHFGERLTCTAMVSFPSGTRVRSESMTASAIGNVVAVAGTARHRRQSSRRRTNIRDRRSRSRIILLHLHVWCMRMPPIHLDIADSGSTMAHVPPTSPSGMLVCDLHQRGHHICSLGTLSIEAQWCTWLATAPAL